MSIYQREKMLWEEFIATRDTLTSRTNFFLIAEAMLLVAYATVVDKNGPDRLAILFIGAGLLLTGMWLMLAGRTHRSLRLLDHIIKKKDIFPEYYEWRELCKISNSTNISANTVIARWVPGVILFLWWLIALYEFNCLY